MHTREARHTYQNPVKFVNDHLAKQTDASHSQGAGVVVKTT